MKHVKTKLLIVSWPPPFFLHLQWPVIPVQNVLI